MTAYSAIVSLKSNFSRLLHYYDAALPPEFLEFYEFANREFKSFQDFVERLNGGSRKRMSALLELLTREMLKYVNFVRNKEYHDFDHFVEITHALINRLKKMEEYYYMYSTLLEDGEEVVSSSKMVGLRDEQSELKEAIADHMVGHSFFLIHGMAGVGKTTLAREIFDDMDIRECFECRAWVRVGLGKEPKEVTEAILAELDPEGGEEEEEEDTIQRLNKILTAKRCLIVLDDVWDNFKFEEYWFRFPSVFKDGNRTRVIVTSRINHLDCSRVAWAWCVYEKRLLNKEESWDLLCEKAFVGGSCPSQLENAGKKIALKCDGLPLTIVTVAGLLSKAEESLWIDVAARRKHQLFIDVYDQISKVLDPSYKELHDELKLCFLYMGVFPLKSKIPRTKLVNLWTVEDIFDPSVKKGELYYHDLESLKRLEFCSLVMVYQRSSTYFHKLPIQAIRTCGLHSSWWYFCQREARKTDFFHVLDCPEDGLEESIKGHSRLSVHNNVLFARKDVYNSMEDNCATTARSLLCFGPYHRYQVPICLGLKLLQRLDALNIRFYEFPCEVVKLVELRYLALTCNGELPPSISKLKRLQYLIVHPHLRVKSRGAPSYMPTETWDLEELKHLQVTGSDLPDSGDKSLRNLSTLLDVSTASCIVLNRLPNLEKLKIRIELTPDADAADHNLCLYAHISNMINLKSLKCVIVNPGCTFQVVHPVASFPVLPTSLKKLSLGGLGYPWEKMSQIALLPSLQQLKLQCNAFQGQNWKVGEGRFPSLYFLLIEDIDLVKLEGEIGSFKSLKHLSIGHCYKLEEIQLRLCDLFMIQVVESNPLAEKSIKKIIMKEATSKKPDILVHYSWKSGRATSIRWSAYRRC